MALFGQGGRSSVETRSSASMRPSTCANGKRSRSPIVDASAISSKRASATSTAIKLPALPGLPTGFTGCRLFKVSDEIAGTVPRIQLFGENAIPASAHSIGRTRQTADQRAIGQTRQGPGLNSRSADVRDRNLPEQLAETVDLLVKQTAH